MEKHKDTGLSSLKCNKCSESYIYPPVHPCKSGHVLCPRCSRHRFCPICKKKFSKTRRRDLEQQAALLLQQCKNINSGCWKVLPSDELNNHHKQCDFRQIRCVDFIGPSGCSWSGLPRHLTSHFLAEHYRMTEDQEFTYDFQVDNFGEVKEYDKSRLLMRFGHMFLARLRYDDSENSFFGSVHLVSEDKDLAREFRYEFHIGKASGEAFSRFMFTRKTAAVSEELHESALPEKRDQFWFPKTIGKDLKDSNGALTVTVAVKDLQPLVVKIKESFPTCGFVSTQYCQRCVNFL